MRSTQVGIAFWLKASRGPLTERDTHAMSRWLERHAGEVHDVVVVPPGPVVVHDPLTFRSYYGDGSYRYGRTDGQIRVGGGVKGLV